MHRRRRDRDVEPGGELRRAVGERLDVVRRAGVGHVRCGFDVAADLGGGALDAVAVLVGADHVGAERGQRLGRSFADA